MRYPHGPRELVTALLLVAGVACGGGSSGGPTVPSSPPPTPAPTPEPAGTIRYLGSTVPEGSEVEVAPLSDFGQQVPALRFSAAITMRQDWPNALVRAWVRTDTQRCMGGGLLVAFHAGVEHNVKPASMSHPGYEAVCPLPYTTTHVEFEVFDVDSQQTVLEQRFPAEYHFVAEP